MIIAFFARHNKTATSALYPQNHLGMTVIWIVIALLALGFTLATLGTAVAHCLAVVGAIVATPAREIARLYHSNQKKKAFTLAALVVSVLVVMPIILVLLSTVIP